MRLAWLSTLALALGAGCAAQSGDPPELRIPEATASVAGRCAGVLLESAAVVLTAAHCLKLDEAQVPVTFLDGQRLEGTLAAIDPQADLALLRLPHSPVGLRGLPLSGSLPAAGSAAYFAGRLDGGAVVQRIEIVRRARCPSLPGVPEALFTSLRGVPGDSGAPVVNEQLHVVGIVHGGARCSIAAPTASVGGMLRGLQGAGASAAPTAATFGSPSAP